MYYNELFIFTTTNRPGHSSARPMAHTRTAATAQDDSGGAGHCSVRPMAHTRTSAVALATAAELATAAYGAAAVLSVQQLRLLAQLLQRLPLVPGDQLAAV